MVNDGGAEPRDTSNPLKPTNMYRTSRAGCIDQRGQPHRHAQTGGRKLCCRRILNEGEPAVKICRRLSKPHDLSQRLDLLGEARDGVE